MAQLLKNNPIEGIVTQLAARNSPLREYQSQEIISHLSSVKATDKSLKKEGASIFRTIFGALTHLNMKLFPGIGINETVA
jgi:hypothetical protein